MEEQGHAVTRLFNELKELTNEPIWVTIIIFLWYDHLTLCSLQGLAAKPLHEESILEWEAEIQGPQDTPWVGCNPT